MMATSRPVLKGSPTVVTETTVAAITVINVPKFSIEGASNAIKISGIANSKFNPSPMAPPASAPIYVAITNEPTAGTVSPR